MAIRENQGSAQMFSPFGICGGCNSVVGGKGTLDVVEWFEKLPMFGTKFVAWATNNSTTLDFFGNPSATKGWGQAAREWIVLMTSDFLPLIAELDRRKQTRLQDLTDTSVAMDEAKSYTGADQQKVQSRAKKK